MTERHEGKKEVNALQTRPQRWQPLMPRVWERVTVDADTGCWTLTKGYIDKWGYSNMSYRGENWLVHRAIYNEVIGTIPDGHQVDHVCRNPSCCNPAHLEAITAAEHVHRTPGTLGQRHAAVTHCPQGHEYSLDNTLMMPRRSKSGKFCRLCATCYPGRRRTLRTMRQHNEEKAA